jgi:hypothetical protein
MTGLFWLSQKLFGVRFDWNYSKKNIEIDLICSSVCDVAQVVIVHKYI